MIIKENKLFQKNKEKITKKNQFLTDIEIMFILWHVVFNIVKNDSKLKDTLKEKIPKISDIIIFSFNCIDHTSYFSLKLITQKILAFYYKWMSFL